MNVDGKDYAMLRIKQSNLEDVFRKNRKIVLFGAGSVTKIMFEAYKKLAFEEITLFYAFS